MRSRSLQSRRLGLALAAILSVCSSLNVHSQVLQSDSLALVAIYNSTNGAAWNNNTNWRTGPVPSWHGVIVMNDRVTGLDLRGNNLTGTLPAEIGDLTNLESLILDDYPILGFNDISGPLPPEIGNLVNLTGLHLQGNRFSGPIPPEIGNLVNLVQAQLTNNRFSGSIPASLGGLTKLQYLSLRENELSGAIPATLGDLTELIDLDLFDQTRFDPNAGLTGAVPASFNNLKKLTFLGLTDNKLEDLPDLTGMTALESVGAGQNRLTFEDIVPNIGLANGEFYYWDQENPLTHVVDNGEEVMLSVDVGGSGNVYQWYKDSHDANNPGIPIAGATNPEFVPTESGKYNCVITNPSAPLQEFSSSIEEIVVVSGGLMVNSTLDTADGDTNDGICDTGSQGGGLTGICTLRAAIETANELGAGKTNVPGLAIGFEIPGAGIPTIQPTSALPVLTVPVEISGVSQPVTGRVALNGDLAGPNVDGLVLAGGQSLIEGLEINRFQGNGIVLRTNGSNVLRNTFIGTESAGQEAAGNGEHGLWIDDAGGNQIGGVNALDINVISGNEGHGILISGENSKNNVIENNRVGVSRDESNALMNGEDGIHIRDASDNQIGSVLSSNGNVIRNNRGAGVSVVGTGVRNTIRKNIIAGNGGMAIDLGGDGPTGNDLGNGLPANMDLDAGPNDLLNFPVGISVAQVPQDGNKIFISGIVDSAEAFATVDLYLSSSVDQYGRGEAESYLASIIPNEQGMFFRRVFPFDLTMPFIVATLTDFAGSTSEFSTVCVGVDNSPDVDKDGDGLCDDWEKRGLDYDGDGTADLRLDAPPFSADPLKKDLFVEIDYMDGHNERPIPGALTDVATAFRNRDIELHLMEDELLSHVDVLKFKGRDPGPNDDFNDMKQGNPVNPCGMGDNDGHFGTIGDRGHPNCAAILGARRLVFHYVIFGHQYKEDLGSSGIAELPGNDFMVTLGSWADATILNMGASRDLVLARRNAQSGTLMHEFGHNLFLGHGGFDGDNCKPNYPSVMSYSLQFLDLVPDRVLDFSRWVLSPLDKRSLDETAGLDGPANRKIVYWNSLGQVVKASANQQPLDWDGTDKDMDGNTANDVGIPVDINQATFGGCPGHGDVLESFNDWDNLLFNFKVSNDFADGDVRVTVPQNEPEKTEQMVIEAAQSFDYDGDGFSNADDNCPAYADPDQTDLDGNGIGDICEQPVNELILLMGSSSSEVKPNQPFTYDLKVYSVGPDASSVSLESELDPLLQFVSANSSAGICSLSGSTVQCDLGEMSLDDSVTVNIVVSSSVEAQVENSASVSSPIFDPDLSDNEVSVSTIVAVPNELEYEIPNEFALEQNFPNPFNPVTTIAYSIPLSGPVRIFLLDILGRPIKLILDEVQTSGMHSLQIDLSDLTSGVYLYRLVSGNYSQTKRMVLLK